MSEPNGVERVIKFWPVVVLAFGLVASAGADNWRLNTVETKAEQNEKDIQEEKLKTARMDENIKFIKGQNVTILQLLRDRE